MLTACRLPFSADSAASVLPQGARPDGGQSDTPDQTGDWLSGLSAALTGPFTAGRIVRAEAVDHRSGLTFEYPVLGRIDPYGMETLRMISDGAGGSELSADTLIGRITVCELPAGSRAGMKRYRPRRSNRMRHTRPTTGRCMIWPADRTGRCPEMNGHPVVFDLVGLESPVMDFVVRVDHLPQSDERQRVLESLWQGGGKISTGLVAAARLGAVCAILGTVGDDWYADQVRREFTTAGIESDGLLVRRGTATSMSLILSDRATGGRNILYTRDDRLNMQPEELEISWIRRARYFYMSHFEPVNLHAAKIARQCGAKVLMDAD